MRRVLAGTGIAVRVALGIAAPILVLGGGLLTYPLGLFMVGIPLCALGIILLYKCVFW